MYEALLDPDRFDPFIYEWTDHIAQVAKDAEQGKISRDAIAETGLIEYFERANLLLDRIGRPDHEGSRPVTKPSDFVISFDLNGTGTEASAAALSPAGDPLNFEDLRNQLDSENADRLLTALKEAEFAKAGAFLTLLQRTDAQDRNQTLAVTAKKSPNGEGAVLLQSLFIVWSDRLEEVISSVYALSPAEIAILRDMIEGDSLNRIAENRGRSLHTVRTHLKSIFRKTSASTQSDVIRNIAAISQFFEQDLSKQSAAEIVHGEPQIVCLPNGRTLHLHMHGPSKGQAVIFVHGMLDGTSITREIEALLYRHNLKLICPIRRGFGAAERELDNALAPKRFAQDMAEYIEQANLVKPVFVGHMSGSVFTFATAHYFPNLVGGVVNVSGGVPLESLSQIHEMTPRQRTIAYTSRFAPKLLPTVLRVAISKIDRDTSLKFMHDLYPSGNFDRKVANDYALIELLYDGYRFAIQQGHFGFESDAHHVIRDWSEFVTNCMVPITCVHGTHDPVVTIKSVRRFCKKHGHANLEEHKDAGQLIFYQKPSAVFDAINALLREVELA